jgi:MerR family transcriptional regulator/heat shock protein HspR
MERRKFDESEPCYVISIAARMVGVHAQTLRYYERTGIIEPSRSRGNIRLYSEKDVERLQYIKTLRDDLGINLAGVEVILRMAEQIAQLQRQLEEVQQEVERLREQT